MSCRADGCVRLLSAKTQNSVLHALPSGLIVDDQSGLGSILAAATGIGTGPAGSAERVLALLGEALLPDLLELYSRTVDLICGGRPSLPGVAPPLTAVMKVRDHHVATSLCATPEPGGVSAPWGIQMGWVSGCMTSAVTAVRDCLRPFTSLASKTTEPEARYSAAWPSHNQAQDQGITLAFAIGILAAITGLERPAATADILLMGAWGDDGYFQPMADEEARRRLEAVCHLTSRILVPAADGWIVAGPGRDTVERLPSSRPTLDGAATALWGDAWLAWKREQHRRELLSLGWVQVPWSAAPARGGLPETSVAQVDALDLLFRGPTLDGGSRPKSGTEAVEPKKAEVDKVVHRPVAAVGGPASSGKSVIVRRLAARICAGKNPWTVLVIAPVSGELPDRHVAVEAGRHALGTLEHVDHRRCLLVLEDLLPIGDGDVGAVLSYLSEALQISILGVVQTDMNSGTEWATDTVELIPAVVGQAELRAFVDHMAWCHPALVDRKVGLAELQRRSEGLVDVGRLVRVMRKQPGVDAQEADEAAIGREGPDQTLRQRFLALNAPSRSAAATLAAASLTRGGVDASMLAGLTSEDLDAFGVGSFRQDGQLKMNSPGDSGQVLRLYLRHGQSGNGQDTPRDSSSPPGSMHDLIADLLMPLLEPALRDGNDGALARLRGARLYHSRVCIGLLRATWASGALRQWLSRASPVSLAGFLLGLTTSLDDDITAAAVEEIVVKINDDPTPMSLHDLVKMVRVLRECVATDSLEFSQIANWLSEQVSAVIDRAEGTTDERLNLLRRVVWFQDPSLNGLVKERIVEIVDHLDPTRATDYYLVPQVQRLQAKAERRATEESSKWPVEAEDDVSRLLKYDPPQETGFHILVAQMLLRRHLEKTEWWPMLDSLEHRFPRALQSSSVRDVTRCIQEVRHSNARQRHSLLNRAVIRGSKDYLNALRRLFLEAAPIEAVELLRAMSSLYQKAAYMMLFRDDNTPNEHVAVTLAEKVKERDDVRAAGMLLSTCRSVEDLYYFNSREGFTSKFGQALGRDWVTERLERDPRISVKYYLIKGLWEAEIPFRDELMETVLDITLQGIVHFQRAWGPRLALQIGLSPDVGPQFLRALRDRLSADDLMQGMSTWSSSDAQVQFHRLGRALFPQMVHQYARDFDLRAFAERLGNASPVAAAECCYEVLRTLQAAGSSVTGGMLLEAADQVTGASGAWVDRLDRVPAAEGFAQLLNVLRKVDPAGARHIVEDYSTRQVRHLDDGDQGADTRLARKVRHAMFDSAVAATSMLRALEQTGGIGRRIYDQLMAEPFVMLIFTGELQMDQSVSEQYNAVSNLAQIGIGISSDWSQWMPAVFQGKKTMANSLGSPKGLVEIIWMMSLWNEEWAYDITRVVDYDKVEERLRRGLVADLVPAIDLAAALLVLNERRRAEQVVEFLSGVGWGVIVDRIGLGKGAVLLRLIREVRPQDATLVAGYINAVIADALDQVALLDDYQMWMDIGHVCHSMAMAGIPVEIPGRPPARQPNLIYAPALAWGLQCLPRIPWRDRLLDAAMRRILAEPATKPTALIYSLASASLAGCLDDLLSVVSDLPVIFRGSLRGLADLYEIAERDTELAAALQPYGAELEKIRQARYGPQAWDRRRLEHSLIRLNSGRTLDEAG